MVPYGVRETTEQSFLNILTYPLIEEDSFADDQKFCFHQDVANSCFCNQSQILGIIVIRLAFLKFGRSQQEVHRD